MELLVIDDDGIQVFRNGVLEETVESEEDWTEWKQSLISATIEAASILIKPSKKQNMFVPSWDIQLEMTQQLQMSLEDLMQKLSHDYMFKEAIVIVILLNS